MKAGAISRSHSPVLSLERPTLDRFMVRKLITDVGDPRIAATIALTRGKSLRTIIEGAATTTIVLRKILSRQDLPECRRNPSEVPHPPETRCLKCLQKKWRQ